MDSPDPVIRPIFQGVILDWCRFHGNQSSALYRTWCGADKTTAERERIVASTLRKIYHGETLETALVWYRKEWADFAKIQNAKVDSAPKLRTGPSSGQSVISYMHAAPCSGDQGELDIRRHYFSATQEQADHDVMDCYEWTDEEIVSL